MTFAGFWVDGAVRKPEHRHCDSDEIVIAKWKRCGDAPIDFVICRLTFSKWDCVYWLDTTPRESLTPEELFSVVRVIMPSANKVNRSQVNPNSFALDPHAFEYTPIEWGNLTQYPPPTEPQWVRITRENVREHMHKPCRFQDNEGWNDGYVAGWITIDGCCLVESDYSNTESVMQWEVVEVQA